MKPEIVSELYLIESCPHKIDKKGYIKILWNGTWAREHRIVAEIILDRELKEEEVIHHMNLDKKDNRPENLMLFPNNKLHSSFHIKLKKFSYLTNPMKREINERCLINL